MNPEKQEKIKSTAGKMAAIAYRWLKQIISRVMEASVRYHEAQTERAAGREAGERKKKNRDGFDRRAI